LDTDGTNLKDILLVEDDPRDVELTLAALEDHPANKVVVVDNGAAALAEFVSPRKGGG
jgi:CheY-like chemotaxis protein